MRAPSPFPPAAAGRGWNAYAFDNFEEAFEWLTEEERVDRPGGDPDAG